MRGGSPLAKCRLFVHKTVRDTRHWGKASQTRTDGWSPALSTIPCPPLVLPLECPGDDSLSPNPNQGARGSAFACGKSSSSVLLSPPSHLGHPLPSGFSNVQNAPLPTHSVLGGPHDQSMVPRPPGASGGSLLTPGMPFVWTTLSTKKWASYNLLARTLTSRNQDSPRGHCPTSWAPHVTNSTTIAPAPFVQGEGVVSLTSPSPPPGPPPGKGAFGQPLDLVRYLQPQPTLPSALHRRAGCAGATSLTMLFLPALLSQAKLGARSRD